MVRTRDGKSRHPCKTDDADHQDKREPAVGPIAPAAQAQRHPQARTSAGLALIVTWTRVLVPALQPRGINPHRQALGRRPAVALIGDAMLISVSESEIGSQGLRRPFGREKPTHRSHGLAGQRRGFALDRADHRSQALDAYARRSHLALCHPDQSRAEALHFTPGRPCA